MSVSGYNAGQTQLHFSQLNLDKVKVFVIGSE